MLKRFFRCLKIELKCICKTKLIWGTVISLLLISGISSIIDYNYTTKSLYRTYKGRINFFMELDYNRQQMIKEGTYNFEDSDPQMQEFMDDIIKAREKVANAVYVISPEYRATYALEQGSLYIPLIAIVIGASIMVSDYKNKTLRHKVLRFGKLNYTASKVAIGLIMSIFIVVTLILLGEIEGACVYSILQKSIPLNEIKLPSITLSSGILVKGGIIVLDTFIYVLKGAIIGALFKKVVPAIVLEIAETIFYVHAKYMPVDILMNLTDKYFDFVGNVKLPPVIKTSMPVVAIYLVVFVASLIGVLTLINYKRSAYK